MSINLIALAVDALAPTTVARFWAGLLGWTGSISDNGAVAILPTDDTTFQFVFSPSSRRKTEQNPIHFHLTSASWKDQKRIADLAVSLGGQHIDVGQLPDEQHIVLADPEGNEFCIIEPTNQYLADCGYFGEVTCSGTHEVGRFWSTALDWPLVWDLGEETAIRSPLGGPKVSWGGEPAGGQHDTPRISFYVAPSLDSDQHIEVDRLIALGAERSERSRDDGSIEMTDPDGVAFLLLTPR